MDECCQQILRQYVRDFTLPEEYAGPVASPFVPTTAVIGNWKGMLVNGGAKQLVRFWMREDGTATFALSDRQPEPLKNIQGRLPGFEGTTSGLIDCDYAADFGVRKLMVHLVPDGGRLIGRVIASGQRPGLLVANIPYVLTLDRDPVGQ